MHQRGRAGFAHILQSSCHDAVTGLAVVFLILFKSGGTISSRSVLMPALASSAAMPPPMTPDPMTAACLIFLLMTPPNTHAVDSPAHYGSSFDPTILMMLYKR
jgi:hypothetical protein